MSVVEAVDGLELLKRLLHAAVIAPADSKTKVSSNRLDLKGLEFRMLSLIPLVVRVTRTTSLFSATALRYNRS
jgi:hypothetical protein